LMQVSVETTSTVLADPKTAQGFKGNF
jgi:hypothetical protein